MQATSDAPAEDTTDIGPANVVYVLQVQYALVYCQANNWYSLSSTVLIRTVCTRSNVAGVRSMP